MKKIYLTIFAIICCSSVFSQQQTVTFKPGPSIGQDAVIATTYGCTLHNIPVPSENINQGDYSEFSVLDWTLNGNGCPRATRRGLLKFSELSTIPADAVIISAELKLYGVSSSGSAQGNSYYPGSPYNSSGSNKSIIQRVTSDWDEQTVTWNTQPTITTANQITVPQSTSRWDYNFTDNSDNLITMVQEMVTHPEANFGFMMKLETEAYYRSLLFASSDYSNPALWPELTVTYEIPCPCEANFSYLANSDTPDRYYFMASNADENHEWIIDGSNVSNESSFTYTFPEGNHQVCYRRIFAGNECEKCITFCTGNNSNKSLMEKKNENLKTTTLQQEKNSFEDEILPNVDNIKVYPNPTTNDWNVTIMAEKEEAIKLQLLDINGKIVYSNDRVINPGENTMMINSNNLTSGGYILKITGDTTHFSSKLLKK